MKNIKNGFLLVILLMSGVVLQAMEPVEQLRGKLTGLTGKLRTVQERTHTLQAMLVRLENRLRALAGLSLKPEPAGLPPMPFTPPAPPASVVGIPTPPAAIAAPMPPGVGEAASELPTDAFRAQVTEVLQLTPDEEHFLFEPLSDEQVNELSIQQDDQFKGWEILNKKKFQTIISKIDAFETARRRQQFELQEKRDKSEADFKQQCDIIYEMIQRIVNKPDVFSADNLDSIEKIEAQRKKILTRYNAYREVGVAEDYTTITVNQFTTDPFDKIVFFIQQVQAMQGSEKSMQPEEIEKMFKHFKTVVNSDPDMMQASREQALQFLGQSNKNPLRRLFDFAKLFVDKLISYERVVKEISSMVEWRSQTLISIYILLKQGYCLNQYFKYATGAILWMVGQRSYAILGLDYTTVEHNDVFGDYEIPALWNAYVLFNGMAENGLTEDQLVAIETACDSYKQENSTKLAWQNKFNERLQEELAKPDIKDSVFLYKGTNENGGFSKKGEALKRDLLEMVYLCRLWHLFTQQQAMLAQPIFQESDINAEELKRRLQRGYEDFTARVAAKRAELAAITDAEQKRQEEEKIKQAAQEAEQEKLEQEEREREQQEREQLQEAEQASVSAEIDRDLALIMVSMMHKEAGISAAQGEEVENKQATQSEKDYQERISQDYQSYVDEFEKIGNFKKTDDLTQELGKNNILKSFSIVNDCLNRFYKINSILINTGKFIKTILGNKGVWEKLYTGDPNAESAQQSIRNLIILFRVKLTERIAYYHQLKLAAQQENNEQEVAFLIGVLDEFSRASVTMADSPKLHNDKVNSLLKIYIVFLFQERDKVVLERDVARLIEVLKEKSTFAPIQKMQAFVCGFLSSLFKKWFEIPDQVVGEKRTQLLEMQRQSFALIKDVFDKNPEDLGIDGEALHKVVNSFD